ncbi:uracil-DNA glycosylase family protein [Chitinimonas sp.]|uniref:uracil-DNA glycosylase n=1 Tax=Chitinimonas sp. TaxID=1934313 RepID=UPI0035AE907E
MNRAEHTLILEELGLMPLWVRPELLDSPQEVVRHQPARAAAETAPTKPQRDAQAHAPLKPAEPARPLAPAARQRAAAQVNTAPEPIDAVAAAQQTAQAAERLAAIARMDWDQLQAAAASCTACELCKQRNKPVFGTGPREADWLVVGEAPGADEDRQGEPFVGQSGQLLDAMLASVGRTRQSNVYILNTVKCRPPQNRNPTPEEMAQCAPFLHRQLELVRPKVVLALGRFAAQTLLGQSANISGLRGQLHDYRGTPVVVSYHPAYLLRNLPEKAKSWQDLLLAQQATASQQAGGVPASAPLPQSEQGDAPPV